jgi:hypothetical protein
MLGPAGTCEEGYHGDEKDDEPTTYAHSAESSTSSRGAIGVASESAPPSETGKRLAPEA